MWVEIKAQSDKVNVSFWQTDVASGRSELCTSRCVEVEYAEKTLLPQLLAAIQNAKDTRLINAKIQYDKIKKEYAEAEAKLNALAKTLYTLKYSSK